MIGFVCLYFFMSASNGLHFQCVIIYYMFRKYWPILYSKLLHKMGHYFLDTQYVCIFLIAHFYNIWWLTSEHGVTQLFSEKQDQVVHIPVVQDLRLNLHRIISLFPDLVSVFKRVVLILDGKSDHVARLFWGKKAILECLDQIKCLWKQTK